MRLLPLLALMVSAMPVFAWGQTAAECASILDPAARASCYSSATMNVDDAIQWLTTKVAQDPAGTQSAMDVCRSGIPDGVDVAVLLNCMYEILGE
jgi:hypothetical protein